MTDESIAQRYLRRAASFTEVVAAVPADRWAAPSPCPDWDARAVVGHVVDTQYLFAGFIDLAPARGPSVDEDPLAAWTVARDHTQTTLDDAALAGREYDGFTGRSTYADGVDQFLSFDLVAHRWDLATAAGLDATIPARDLAELEAAVQNMTATMGEAMRGPGAFGPALEPPAGADAQTRLLAFLGRRV